MSAAVAVQTMVVAALDTLPGVSGVFDGPAPDTPPPYLVVGPTVVGPAGSTGVSGHEHRVTVTAWDRGPGVVAVATLVGRAEAALLALSGSAAGHRIVNVTLLRSQVDADAEGWSRGTLDLRIVTQTNP